MTTTLTHHTIRRVLAEKLATEFQSWTLAQIIRTGLLTLLAGLLSAAFWDTEATGRLLHDIVEWHNFALCKTAIIFGLVFQSHRLRAAYGHLKGVLKASAPKVPTIETMNTEGVIEHLVTEGTFKRHEVMAKFRPVAQYRVERLTKKLKEIGVLTTGENGMSIFDSSYTRQDLAELFRGKREAAELEKLFRRDGNGLTNRPTPLSPAPALPSPFTSQKVSAGSQETDAQSHAPRTVRAMREAYAAACAAA